MMQVHQERFRRHPFTNLQQRDATKTAIANVVSGGYARGGMGKLRLPVYGRVHCTGNLTTIIVANTVEQVIKTSDKT